jgi:hypothetical protein
MTEGHAAIEMAILDFYEDAAIICSTLCTSDQGGGRNCGDCSRSGGAAGAGRGKSGGVQMLPSVGVQMLPSVGPTYRLFFSGNALAVSRICGVCSSLLSPHSDARSSCLGLAAAARMIGASIHCVCVKVLSRSRERLQRARRLPLASPAAVHGGTADTALKAKVQGQAEEWTQRRRLWEYTTNISWTFATVSGVVALSQPTFQVSSTQPAPPECAGCAVIGCIWLSCCVQLA